VHGSPTSFECTVGLFLLNVRVLKSDRYLAGAEVENKNYTPGCASIAILAACFLQQDLAQACRPDDMWALGVIFYQTLTAFGAIGESMFGPNVFDIRSLAKLPYDEKVAKLHRAVKAEQDIWVSTYCTMHQSLFHVFWSNRR